MRSCYIFDIDGTLSNNDHRTHHLLKQPKDWEAYHALVAHDTPHEHICELAIALSKTMPIIYCSGRHDGQRRVTENWLMTYAVPGHFGLYMRKEGDHRPDHIIKRELLDQIRADGFDPIMAFDDRNQVVDMWREAGIPCAQVAPGNF